MRKLLHLSLLALAAAPMAATAQEASWRVGVNLAPSINFSAPGYQELTVPGRGPVGSFVKLNSVDGVGIAPYFGLFGEYNSGSFWGIQLRASYDARGAVVKDISQTPNNEIDATWNYLTIEPLFKINNIGTEALSAVVGPLVGFNLAGRYTFTPGDGSPAIADIEFTDKNSMTFGATAGLSYDIFLTDKEESSRWVLSPFVDASWMLHQRGLTVPDISQDKFDDSWSTVSARVGVRFAYDKPIRPTVMVDAESAMFLSLNTPAGGYVRQREVVDYFPLLRHVFFDSASTAIPDRYKKLSSSEGASFEEGNVAKEAVEAVNRSGNIVDGQMKAYYNIVNVVAARMKAKPEATVTLIGSDPAAGTGKEMAEEIKKYMVDVFGIDPARISTEGKTNPRVISGSDRTPKEDKHLANAENKRVEFESKDAAYLFAPLQYSVVDKKPIENDLVFTLDESEKINSWSVVFTGEGKTTKFGPFDETNERISPTELLAGLDAGKYTASVTATTEDGRTLTAKKSFNLERVKEIVKGSRRYVITFEYGQADAVKSYETFLRDVVAGNINTGDRVIIHGHTDNIGAEKVNRRISDGRAKEATGIVRDQVNKLGKKASFESIGAGEARGNGVFDNSLPEGRFYNRNVTIEVVPAS